MSEEINGRAREPKETRRNFPRSHTSGHRLSIKILKKPFQGEIVLSDVTWFSTSFETEEGSETKRG